MNKLWDDLKDNMKEWGASAVEKAEEISRVAVAKGEEFTKISKIKIEIMQIEKEIAKDFEILGKLVHKYAHDDNMVNSEADEKSSMSDFVRNGLAVAVFCGLVILFMTVMRKP